MTSATSPARLSQLLGPLQGLLTPRGTLLLCALGWGVTAPFSSAPLAIGLCWWGIALLLWSLQIERPWLEVLPFPPLTVLALHLFLRWELGGLLLLLAPAGSGEVRAWSDHVAQALPINAVCTTALVGAALINWRWIRRPPRPSPARVTTTNNERGFGKRQLLMLGAITGVVAVGYAFVGFFGGTLDRGAPYLQWAGKLWRPDTLFSATIRLRDLYFLILPWLIWRWRRSVPIVALFLVPTTASLLLTAMLGGRGLLIYPGLLLLGGLWLVGTRAPILRALIGILAALALFLTAVMPALRSSDAFRATSGTDLLNRLGALRGTTAALQSPGKLAEVGRDLYAWSDPYLFQEPGLSQAPAGTKRLHHLLYLWIPRAWMPDRPEINDGHLIAKEIMGTPDAGMHEGRHIWFPGISFGADLYWRFRWPGVIIGSSLFGLGYALLCRLWYRLADLNRSTASALIAIYPATFLQGPPLRSVSETAWNWLYEFPKYVLILAVITLLIEALSRLWPGQPRARES